METESASSVNTKSVLVINNTNGCKELMVTDNIRLGTYLHNTGISDTSRPAYKRTLVKFFTFYNVGISEVTDIHINLYITSLPVGDSTKNFVIKVLSSFFTYMFKTGYISQNPSAVIRQIKVADKLIEKILSFEQVKQMIETEQNVRNRTFLIVLYYAGLRVSEALSVKWKNFRVLQDGAAQLTIIGKGRKARTLHIPEDIYKIICENLNSKECDLDDFIFKSKDSDKAFCRRHAIRICKNAALKARIDKIPSPHWFRHSNATHAIDNGAPIHLVQKSLGHSDISTVGRYLHSNPMESTANFLKR